MNYASAAASAARMIRKAGTSAMLQRTVAGTYNPATDTTTGGRTDSYPCRVVILPASKGTIEAFDTRWEGEALIETNLRSVLMAAKGLPIAPGPGDFLVVGSETWKVIGSTPLAPDGTTAIFYRLGVRR